MQFDATKVYNCGVNFLLKKIVFLEYNFWKKLLANDAMALVGPSWIHQ